MYRRVSSSECPFCAVGERKWLENDAAVAFPDAYPLAEGHTLVAPRPHVRSLYELNAHQQSLVWELVAEVRQRLLVGLKPDAFNIGVNDGLAAGQTVDHAHVHVIPRWNGDVADPRGGIRWILDDKADYWSK